MITVIVIALALCAVVLFYMAVRSRRKQAVQSLRPVDLPRFTRCWIGKTSSS